MRSAGRYFRICGSNWDILAREPLTDVVMPLSLPDKRDLTRRQVLLKVLLTRVGLQL